MPSSELITTTHADLLAKAQSNDSGLSNLAAEVWTQGCKLVKDHPIEAAAIAITAGALCLRPWRLLKSGMGASTLGGTEAALGAETLLGRSVIIPEAASNTSLRGHVLANGWDEAKLMQVDTRKLIGNLASVNGLGLRATEAITGSNALGLSATDAVTGSSAVGLKVTEAITGSSAHGIHNVDLFIRYNLPIPTSVSDGSLKIVSATPHGLVEFGIPAKTPPFLSQPRFQLAPIEKTFHMQWDGFRYKPIYSDGANTMAKVTTRNFPIHFSAN